MHVVHLLSKNKNVIIFTRLLGDVVAVNMKTNLPINLPVSIGYNVSPINTDNGFVYAAAILLGLYVLIISEVWFSNYNITNSLYDVLWKEGPPRHLTEIEFVMKIEKEKNQ